MKEVADTLLGVLKQAGNTMIMIVVNDATEKVIEVRTVEGDTKRVQVLLEQAIHLTKNPGSEWFVDEHGHEIRLDAEQEGEPN